MTALQQEWLALQAQHERYEGWALAVKLAAAAAAFATGPLAVRPLTAAVVLAVLWLQEAVLKTFQARLGERLLAVESCLRAGADVPAMQLHSDWLTQRPRGLGLLAQYLRSALRPTVAWPYPLLVAWVLVG